MSDPLRIATLNTWGIFYAPRRKQRLQAIAITMTRSDYDIVGLQEVWQDDDFAHIQRAAKTTGYHIHRFDTGPVGSGLVTLSRFPIMQTDFLTYRAAGSPETAYHGDYIADKGIALCIIDSPSGEIAFYNTHLIAQYTDDASDHYQAHRAAQMVEAATFINRTAHGRPCVLVGDLNTRPDQLGWRIMTEKAGMQDAWATRHVDEPGYTLSTENTYISNSDSTRIDYVMSRDGTNTRLQVQSVAVSFQMIADLKVPFSDHYGLVAEIKLQTQANVQASGGQLHDATRSELLAVLEAGADSARGRRAKHGNRARMGLWMGVIWRFFHRDFRRWAIPLTLAYTLVQAMLAWLVHQEARNLKVIRDEVEAR